MIWEAPQKSLTVIAVSTLPLRRAEHHSSVRIKELWLFERSEFHSSPHAVRSAGKKRLTGVFFWFVFFHAKENERSERVMIKILHYIWPVRVAFVMVWNGHLNWVFQILGIVIMNLFSMDCFYLNSYNLKPVGITDLTASTASDATPHRPL